MILKRKSDKQKFLAGHQRSWVWGRHAVQEILKVGRWPVRESFFAETLGEEERQTLQVLLRPLDVTPSYVSSDRIRSLCGAKQHQGFLLRMGPFPYASWEDVHSQAGSSPLYLLLDRIRDAHNFGTLIRSAAALNASAVIIGQKEQTPVNSQVVRSSAGAVMHMPIVQVADCLVQAEAMKREGITLIAAEPEATVPVWNCNFKRPAVLLLGNEAQGISDALSAAAQERICIPRSTDLDSLNVAAAAAAIMYESYRQKNFDI